MGTSNSHTRPGGTPLLPPWADDAPPNTPPQDSNDNDSQVSPTPVPTLNPRALSNARSDYSGYASGHGGSLSKAVREYVRANRGAQNATRASRASKSSTSSLGGFLAGVAQRGVDQALRDIGLSDAVGSSISNVMTAVLNAIAPDGNTLDQAVARQAETDTLKELYSKFDLNGGIDNLERMTEVDVQDALILSVSNHIFHRFVNLLEIGLQNGDVSPEQAVQAENDARYYIREKVRVDFGEIDVLNMNWKSDEATNLIENIFNQAHIILEEV